MLGSGVVIFAISLLGAVLDAWLLGGPDVLFGVAFLAACCFAATRARPGDLTAAPASAPIAFAAALLLTDSGSGGGLPSHVVGLATSLALHAGWLYGGTGLAAVVAVVRGRRARR